MGEAKSKQFGLARCAFDLTTMETATAATAPWPTAHRHDVRAAYSKPLPLCDYGFAAIRFDYRRGPGKQLERAELAAGADPRQVERRRGSRSRRRALGSRPVFRPPCESRRRTVTRLRRSQLYENERGGLIGSLLEDSTSATLGAVVPIFRHGPAKPKRPIADAPHR
jgi:hypothetical protein